MGQKMIVNLRGTHGSGKSTVVRALIRDGGCKPIFGLFGLRKPEAYKLSLNAATAYVLGPYETECGGCDAIQPYDLILDLIQKYQAKGHVILEGALVSSSYGRVGRLLEELGGSFMVFLTTPLEECIRRIEARRKSRGDDRPLNPKNTVSKFNQIQGSKEKIRAAGKVQILEWSSEEAPAKIVTLLEGGL